MAPVHNDKIEARAVGIKADGSAGMSLGPVLHEHAILHDDVVTTSDELVDVHVLGAIIQLEAETDV